ncbi:MAG: YlbF family regulator [Coprobacillus sp.]|nr:YlbF family regulator [Coprobacillus sp.]
MDLELCNILEKIKNDLKSSEAYLSLIDSETLMNESSEVKALSEKMKEDLDEYNRLINEYSENDYRVKEAQKALQSSKNALYSHPLVKNYLLYYRGYQNELDKINEEVISPLKTNLCQKKH